MLRRRLSPRRVLHTLGVEAVAACMAMRWGCDAEAARRAALLHDMTKEDPDPLQSLRDYGILPSEWEKTVPNVYHALSGAALARELGFDEGIASAVRWHTTGRAGMTVLEKVLYLADKAEPFRQAYPELSAIKLYLYSDLDQALYTALRRIKRYKKEGGTLEQNTVNALRWIESKCGHGDVKKTI